MRLKEGALDRILLAVGDPFVPSSIDRSKLQEDLEWSATWHAVAVRLGKLPFSDNTRNEKLEKAYRAAHELQTSLDDETWSAISNELPPEHYVSNETIEWIATAAKAAQKSPGRDAPLVGIMGVGVWSSFEWFVGSHLAFVYEKHFKRMATRSRDKTTGLAGGPYVRFANAALTELAITNEGKPYSVESIASAIQNVRRGRARRKT